MNWSYSAPLSLKDIHIDDLYWNRYIRLITDVVIPYQWEILNDRVPDAVPSYCLRNFKIAAGKMQGTRQGTVFQDSDAAKWLEAVAYSLASHPDAALEKEADGVIELITGAQQPDGYLNTYFTLVDKNGRWKNLAEGHELYCAGHLIEAGAAYYQTTGKTVLLKCVCRLADLISTVFGPGEKQIHGCPGHPEIELALVRLYRITGVQRYLDTAKYFLDIRGTAPNYFLEEMKRPEFHHLFSEFADYDPAYSQSHMPLYKQTTAEGHAVRAVYLYCAMADIAEIYKDEKMLLQCRALWINIVQKRMYITGSIGSSGFLERFTVDYDLPNDSNYSETCASIGLALFGLRMSRNTGDASYIDVCERALYNTIRAGISLQGDRYFYVNPLEVWPDSCIANVSKSHVKPQRQKWFDVACCPTNIARTFSALGQYMYSLSETGLYINLFINNNSVFKISGTQISIDMQTDYPRTGNIHLSLVSPGIRFTLFIRVPEFANDFRASVNGQPVEKNISNGYFCIDREWADDSVSISFTIRPRIVYANPLVRADCGKAAVIRGPEVFCFEETDNGSDLAAVYLDTDAPLREEWREDLFGGTMTIRCSGYRLVMQDCSNSISPAAPEKKAVELTAVPYGFWCNRKPGEMIVWLHQK